MPDRLSHFDEATGRARMVDVGGRAATGRSARAPAGDGWAGVVNVRATARTEAKTGVEMEALVAVSVAALTFYDMCKAVDKGMVIDRIYLVKKTGGKSGAYRHEGPGWSP